MPSYQDIESRLRQVEDKLSFAMKLIKFARKEGLIEPRVVTHTIEDLYYASKAAGLELVAKPVDSPAPENA